MFDLKVFLVQLLRHNCKLAGKLVNIDITPLQRTKWAVTYDERSCNLQ